jgi:hypothetical protein
LDELEPAFDEIDLLPFFVELVRTFPKAILNDNLIPVPINDGIYGLRVARAAPELL